MELNFTEVSSNNTKQVSFVYEDEVDDNVEDIGTFDDAANFIPASTLTSTPIQNSKYTPDLPNVGKFQTINRPKPVNDSNTRVNAPVDASMYTQKTPPKPVNKKQISYDDILNSMSMRVGPDGKLQMHSQKLQEHQVQQTQQHLPNRQQQQPFQRQPFVQQQQQQYQYQQQEEPPQQPLTKRQYQQLVVLDLIRRQQEQQRLNEVKSTKLVFPNPNVRITTAPRPGVNLNRLFRLK